MKRTISLLVNNQMGVLNRLTNLFLRKGLNIESLAVAPVNDSDISLMTIIVHVAEEKEITQIKLQLNKQIDVIQITDISEQIALC